MDIFSPAAVLWVGIAALILTLPGTALYLLARQVMGRDTPKGIRHAPLFGIGLSIALWPLLLLLTSLVGLPFGWWISAPLLVLSAAYLVWRIRILGRPALTYDARPYAVAVGGMTLLALLFRLGDINGLSVPMFGDSLHHTMITTMILDHGRVPGDWLPYVPVKTFTYHFGFHTLSAVLAQLTGLTAAQAVLIMGQVLNVMSVPAAFLLNRRIFGSRLAGLGAALITGFISIMPAFYVNWGRYTQLTGHVLLVIALTLVVGIGGQRSDIRSQKLEAQKSGTSKLETRNSLLNRLRWFIRRDMVLTAICVAGLVVVHYRVLIFFGLFLIALATWYLASLWGRWRDLLITWARMAAATGMGLLLALPWIIHLAADYVPGLARRLETVTGEYLAQYNDPGSVRIFVGTALPLLAFAGIVAAIAGLERRRSSNVSLPLSNVPEPAETILESGSITLPNPRTLVLRPSSPNGLALVMAIWALLLVGSLWIVPGAIGGYTVAITLYIPLASLGGFGIDRVIRLGLGQVRLGKAEGWLPAAAMLAATPIAAIATGTWHIGDPAQYAYVHRADREAFAWIAANTPPSTKFLISSEFSYAGRGLTATDAGMWLPLLAGAGRTVSIPASITGNEKPIDPQFIVDTRQLAAYTQPMGSDADTGDSVQEKLVAKGIIPHTGKITGADALALMQKLGCQYVYIGTSGGLSKSRLDLEAIKTDPKHFVERYSADGALVFEIMP